MAEKAVELPAAGVIRARRSTVIACVLIGAAVFASFLVADFPYSDTLTSMLAPYQLRLTYQSQRLSPPIGARLSDVRLFSTAGITDQALLQSPAVTIAPTLAALLFGRPGIHVRADLYGGTVHVTLYQHADTIDLNFSLDALQLAQSAPLRQLGAIVTGNLSGAGSAHIGGPDLPDDQGTMAIAGDNLAVSLAHGFPAIHLGTLTGNFELAQGAIKLTDIVAHGADLDLKAAGTIELGASAQESTIDLTFYLNPTQRGRDHFGFFMKLLPHPPGPDAPYSVQGYLVSPSVS
jgi:type II secretion system protein N